MNRAWALGFCLIAIAALTLRCVRLDNRPMHNDEAVNALKLADHWSTNQYRYDPNEHHGPALYYASLPAVWLSGTRNYTALNESIMRLTPALFGVALVVLLWLLRDGLGRGATLTAAGLTALSPAMVFYSRYYIHEMLLGFFTLLALVGGWRYTQNRRAVWAMVAGAGLALMYATKETFVFAGAALVLALVLTAWMDGGAPALRQCLGSCKRSHLIAALLTAAFVAGLLFTSFGTNWSGPLDSLRTYLPWLKRAGGDSPHIHPWHFYLERLVWYQRPKSPVWTEGLIFGLGFIGIIAAWRGRWLGKVDVRLARFLSFYTLTITAIYALISYKTPWCLVGFLHGWILLAGVGVAVLVEFCRPRWAKVVLGAALSVGTAHLAWLSWQANFVRFADWRNPYVYAQTVPDVLRLTQQIAKLASVHPDREGMVVKVVAPGSDYWPLPYYLRQFTQVGWFDALPEEPYSAVMVTAAKLNAALDERTDKRWIQVGLFELRPRVFLELYVELELWKRWIASRPPPKEEDE